MVASITRVVLGGLSLLTLAQASPGYDALTPHRKVKIPTPHVRRDVKHHVKHRVKHSVKHRTDNSTGLGTNLQRDLVTLKAFASTITQDPTGLVANWTAEDPDVCSFSGVHCEADPAGKYALGLINFNDYYLGTDLSLFGFLDKLYDLALFHANSNGFSGTVPDLSALPYLYEVDLSNNLMSGEFPLALLGPRLDYLDLRYNSFTGPLPTTLFYNQSFEYLILNNNQFTGPIPDFEASSNVSYVVFANNNFTGPIPASWANDLALVEILFLNNTLEGTIPDSVCALPQLELMDVSGNPGIVGPLGPACSALYNAGGLVINGTAIQV